MNTQLRNRLRNLNMEISTLLRDKTVIHREARLLNLRRQRDHLMGLFAADGGLRVVQVKTAEGVAAEEVAEVDISHLLPRANSGMSA